MVSDEVQVIRSNSLCGREPFGRLAIVCFKVVSMSA